MALSKTQARAALVLAEDVLNRAGVAVRQTSFVASRANLKRALYDRIEQLRGYAARIKNEVDTSTGEELPPLTAKKVDLLSRQVSKALVDTDKAAAGSNAPLWPDYVKAMGQIVGAAASAVSSATPWWFFPIIASIATVTAVRYIGGRKGR